MSPGSVWRFRVRNFLKFLLVLMLIPQVCFGAASQTFNATTSQEGCGSNSVLDNIFSGGSGGTIIASIKNAGVGENNNGYIVSKLVTGGWNFASAQASGTRRLVFFHFFSGTDLSVESASNSIVDNTIQNVAITWDGSATATNVHLYIDGVEVSYAVQTNGTGTPDSDASHNFIIGNRAAGDRTFNGDISYVKAYTRQLSIAEINEVIRVPSSIPDGNVLYRSMWEQSGKDLSGNGNTCTSSNLSDSSNGPPVMFGGGLPL